MGMTAKMSRLAVWTLIGLFVLAGGTVYGTEYEDDIPWADLPLMDTETYDDTEADAYFPEEHSDELSETPAVEEDQSPEDADDPEEAEKSKKKDKGPPAGPEESAEAPAGARALGAAPAAGGAAGEGGTYRAPLTPESMVFTGAASYTIPIEVPPGRSGLAPDLALTYNSYNSNGWLGMGWDLDLGAICRSTKFGISYGRHDYVAELPTGSKDLLPWGGLGPELLRRQDRGRFQQILLQQRQPGLGGLCQGRPGILLRQRGSLPPGFVQGHLPLEPGPHRRPQRQLPGSLLYQASGPDLSPTHRLHRACLPGARQPC